MPLSIGNIDFKTKLAEKLRYFFSEDENENNPYYVNPYNGDGSLKSEIDIRIESKQKLEEFSNDIAAIIYDFVKSGTIPPGIPVQVNTGTGTGATTGNGQII